MSLTKFAAPFLVAALGATPALAQPPAFGGAKMLIHGNYCGPGNNAPLPPIDALDAACARHDACTPSGGLPSRACNMRLEHEAQLIERDPRQPQDIRSLAGLIAAGAAVFPSGSGTRFAAGPMARPVAVPVTQDPGAVDPRGFAPDVDAGDDGDEGE